MRSRHNCREFVISIIFAVSLNCSRFSIIYPSLSLFSSMAFKHYVLLCIVLLTSSFFITSDALPASQHLFHRLQKRSGHRLCGSMLVEALAAVCQSEYYAPTHVKRTFGDNSDWDTYPEGVFEPAPLDYFFSINQLSRRGVADECCLKSCTIGQLASYCGPIPRK